MKNPMLAVLACGLLTVPATATVLIPADLAELARDADVIARGRITSVDGRWTDGRRAIETLVTLEAESFLKGRLTDTLQFRVPGGTLGRYRNIVMGAPQFRVGQRVIVFLGARGPEVPYILGLNQGVYRVGVSAGGEAMVSPPPVMPGVAGPIVRGAVSRTASALTAFERDIRVLAGVAP